MAGVCQGPAGGGQAHLSEPEAALEILLPDCKRSAQAGEVLLSGSPKKVVQIALPIVLCSIGGIPKNLPS